ncbi:hypothetical protein FFLO_06416 [Filobasidium floriforme]|uniref:Protein CPL1-like domain-containing protein n=1 Tax=Filobasidium floriforme TaxID=5210 RepID=A0A8K0NKL0_9TREE|nr:uncharacterized protein HD553DRAFT_363741 [Filobasidium floriforme]KAG7528102.1 hypothetical protein FFLO_06416 [Filobasidium floriforme]KAH8079038.1 hypothetical protein HD553DRAFT_363741 [Filobasidium floriforme]
MFSFTKSLVAAVALLAILPSSLAQTAPPATTSGTATADQRRISACQATIETPGFNNEENYLTSDTNSYSVRYTYDFAACDGVPVLSSRLTNYGTDGTFVACTYSQFTAAGEFTSVCPRTRGSMATAAGTAGQDFSSQLRFGVRPTIIVREDVFTVYGVEAPTSTAPTSTAPAATTSAATASQLAQRRRRAVETGEVVLTTGMICDAGETACPMRDSRKRSFSRCIDTANELYACGGCPGAAGTQDCSELKGVADVQCVQGTCQINQCDRSHKLSSDGKTCVRKDSVAKRSFW